MSREREGDPIKRGIVCRIRRSVNAGDKGAFLTVYIVLALVALGFCGLFVLRFGIFGSRVDWVNQHSVFPDYFRQRFYETKDLLPDFAWNLGAGQNIYTVSYYGLFSPVILLSYLLPFVRMDIYIMASSIASYVTAVLLLFYWLKNHRYRSSFCLVLTLLFSLSSSLIYQFYNQIMFVNYMPFLCLALIGTDRYLSCRKRGCLLLGIWGMILTSFYFSIGGMLALCLYALSEYLMRENAEESHMCDDVAEREWKKNRILIGMRGLFCTGVRYVGQMMLAVLLSGVLLVPTALVIIGGERTQTEHAQDALKLIAFEPLKILYYPYGVGTSVFVIVAVLGGIFCAKHWAERVLPVSLFLVFAFPAVGVLLNGGLYEKYKVFIPFLPLLILQCARFLDGQMRRRWSLWQVVPWLITGLLLWKVWQDPSMMRDRYPVRTYALAELIGCGICFCVAKWKKKPELVVIFPILCLFGFQMGLHSEADRMLSRTEYSALHEKQVIEQVEQIGKEDTGFYRTEVFLEDTMNHNNINRLVNMDQYITSLYSSCYNDKYAVFRKNIFHINEPFRNNMMQSMTDNPCFLQFMGVKYRLTRQNSSEIAVTRNGNAAPLWYVTNQVISESEYMGHTFPECQTVLLQRSVVPDAEMDETHRQKVADEVSALPEMIRQSMTIPERDSEDCRIQMGSDGTYQIQAKENVTISVPITGQNSNQDLLAISFDIENKHPTRDIKIGINQQMNTLTSVNNDYANHNDTFHYMISHPANQNIEITFGKGEYEIRNWNMYAGCMAALQNRSLYQQPVKTDRNCPQGDGLSGKVSCDTAGYLITSIPYDDHFEITIDGQPVDPICVNTAFLGAKLEAGEYVIRLEYHAPGKRGGIWMSILGIGLWLVSGIFGMYRLDRIAIEKYTDI